MKVDGILLLTAGTVTKRNFSVSDIEENIPGTFKPKNMLPEYVKLMEKNNTESHDIE